MKVLKKTSRKKWLKKTDKIARAGMVEKLKLAKLGLVKMWLVKLWFVELRFVELGFVKHGSVKHGFVKLEFVEEEVNKTFYKTFYKRMRPYKYGGGPWAARSISDYPYLNDTSRDY